MRTETVIKHVSCDVCKNSEEKGFSIKRMRVAVLDIGHYDEYGHFHEVIGKNVTSPQLDLCKKCASLARDRVLKRKTQMFTPNVYYVFQDLSAREGKEE